MFVKDSSLGTEGAGGYFIGGSEKSDLGSALCGRQVHGAGIIGDKEIAPT